MPACRYFNKRATKAVNLSAPAGALDANRSGALDAPLYQHGRSVKAKEGSMRYKLPIPVNANGDITLVLQLRRAQPSDTEEQSHFRISLGGGTQAMDLDPGGLHEVQQSWLAQDTALTTRTVRLRINRSPRQWDQPLVPDVLTAQDEKSGADTMTTEFYGFLFVEVRAASSVALCALQLLSGTATVAFVPEPEPLPGAANTTHLAEEEWIEEEEEEGSLLSNQDLAAILGTLGAGFLLTWAGTTITLRQPRLSDLALIWDVVHFLLSPLLGLVRGSGGDEALLGEEPRAAAPARGKTTSKKDSETAPGRGKSRPSNKATKANQVASKPAGAKAASAVAQPPAPQPQPQGKSEPLPWQQEKPKQKQPQPQKDKKKPSNKAKKGATPSPEKAPSRRALERPPNVAKDVWSQLPRELQEELVAGNSLSTSTIEALRGDDADTGAWTTASSARQPKQPTPTPTTAKPPAGKATAKKKTAGKASAPAEEKVSSQPPSQRSEEPKAKQRGAPNRPKNSPKAGEAPSGGIARIMERHRNNTEALIGRAAAPAAPEPRAKAKAKANKAKAPVPAEKPPAQVAPRSMDGRATWAQISAGNTGNSVAAANPPRAATTLFAQTADGEIDLQALAPAQLMDLLDGDEESKEPPISGMRTPDSESDVLTPVSTPDEAARLAKAHALAAPAPVAVHGQEDPFAVPGPPPGVPCDGSSQSREAQVVLWLDSVAGTMATLAQDWAGCDVLLPYIEGEFSLLVIGRLLHELSSSLSDVMCNECGSQMMCKLIAQCNTQQRLMILRQIGPTIFKISSSANGMWTVQTLINCLDSHEEVERLQRAMKGRVAAMMVGMYASQVLVCCASRMIYESANSFIFRELSQGIGTIIHSPTGITCLNSLLDIATVGQAADLANAISGQVMRLARHKQGNHVVQMVIDKIFSAESPEGKAPQKILKAIAENILAMSADRYATSCVERLLQHADAETMKIVTENVFHADNLERMMADQYGCYAVQTLIMSVSLTQPYLSFKLQYNFTRRGPKCLNFVPCG